MALDVQYCPDVPLTNCLLSYLPLAQEQQV